MKKKIIAMLTVICLLSMLFSISTFASDIDTVQSENHHFTQDEMTKLVEQNIIYQEEIPVQLTDTKARTVVEATVRFRVHYDNTNGLAFSTEVIAEALLTNVSGSYKWIPFGSGVQNAYPFSTSQIVPTGVIYNYTVTGYHYNSGTQIQCRSEGKKIAVVGGGTFTKTALVTIP